LYAGGYDDRIHIVSNYDSQKPITHSYDLGFTPFCLKIWKDSWLLIGGKGQVKVFSLLEKKFIHTWEIATSEKQPVDVSKMLLFPDFTFLCGCTKGVVQVHGFSSPRLCHLQLEPDTADVNDMLLNSTKSRDLLEYALATEEGLIFIQVKIKGGDY
jgi:hypothetical protein